MAAAASDDPLAPDDLAALPELNDEAVLNGIRMRFASNKIYTRINNLLIAMNPYQQLPIYTAEAMAEYKAAPVGSLPPHVYGTAAASFAGMLALHPQSIVISGESGAGKSETAKKVLQHLAFAASRGGSQSDGIEARILASSPLLEAFGNAKTSMNNNSSRYGKFLMLQFDTSGTLSGALIKTYLLEKTRVVQQGNLERGYHIGYMLCQSAELAPLLGLPPARELQYLGQTGCLVSPGWDDAQELADCLAASDHLGMPRESRDRLWRIVAALLLLGELDFGPADAAESSIGDVATLQKLCGLLEADSEAMSKGLTIKMTKMGSDWIAAPNTPARASELRHGFARSIYSTCFDWLVGQINKSLKLDGVADAASSSSSSAAPAAGGGGGAAYAAAGGEGSATQQFIGILDIFGFETFDVNSLEQLCINFCNERLQNTFNEAVFTSVQEENAAEGIELPEADFSEIDNGAVVKLIGGRPNGILHALNEECVVPKGTDQTMLDKLFEAHKGSKLLRKPLKPREAFTVEHFVGPVTYLATNMLLKNKDPVSEDLMVLLQRSRSPFVQALFSTQSETKTLLAKKKDTRFQGVAAKFTKQLDELLKKIGASHMHFVRCIKPNRDKVPQAFADDLVVSQMRCSGVFEAVRVIGMGFPDRLPHFMIIGQFARLLPEADRPEIDEDGMLVQQPPPVAVAAVAAGGEGGGEGGGEEEEDAASRRALTEGEAVADVLYKLGCAEGEFALGISKVFLKAGVLARLRGLQQLQMEKSAVIIQACARAHFARDRVLAMREERQRALEAEAAAALAAALEAEEEARKAAAELEEAAADEAARAAAAAEGAAESVSQTRRAASEALAEVEHARTVMLHGGKLGDENGLAESRWRRVQRMKLKINAVATLGGSMFVADEEKQALEASKEARGLLNRRTESRKSLVAEGAIAAAAGGGGGKGGGGGAVPTIASLGLNLNTAGLGAGGLDTSMLSHRDAGGGVAPLMSARAPVRREVKKVSEKNKKDAKWMDMVLEYAVYLGMDTDEDAELLWIAEQALRAPVPEGWEEMMDPFGDLYFFNETTSQSTRQHPMDGYYQQLYLKLRLQRAGGFAGADLPPPPPPPPVAEPTKKGRGRRSNIRRGESTEVAGRLAERASFAQGAGGAPRLSKAVSLSEDSAAPPLSHRGMPQSFRGMGSSSMPGATPRGDGGLTSRLSLPQRHVISSISEALEISSPRSAKFMLDRFGLKEGSTEDERCLLINPAIWRVPAEGDGEVPFVECMVEKDELGLGLNRLSLYICLNDNNEAFALGALKRMVNQNTMYELTMSENEEEVDVHYTGKLSCNARGNEFVIYDDLHDAVGIREGQARRELGVILIGTKQLGQSLPIEFVIPRVQRDGATAQFRPKQLGDSMIQQYKAGRTKHLFVLRGLAQLVPGGRVQLRFRGGDHAAIVFEAYRATGERWAVRYRHPLSALQAFNLAIAVLHNQQTAMLDMLPPLDEVVHAPPPTLSLNLAQISSLQHAYGVVYSLTVYGSRVFCGMHSGHVQQWHLPMGAPPAVLEWRAHSGTVYALCVVGRSLVTGSRDWLLRVWDLQSLTLVATLPGHRGAVRCLTSSVHAPNILYSGANDTTVRVWDVATLQGGTSKKQILRGHRKWVRALCCSADGSKLISAARDVKVWSTADLTLKHTLSVGAQVYALAVCRVNVGMAAAGTLFAGSTKGRVHFWRLDELQPRGANQRGELDSGLVKKIRALSCHGHMLFCGDQAGGVCAHDISTLPAQRRPLEAHTAGVRAIDADPVSNLVFTAGDDRIVRVWGEMSFTFTEETRI